MGKVSNRPTPLCLLWLRDISEGTPLYSWEITRSTTTTISSSPRISRGSVVALRVGAAVKSVAVLVLMVKVVVLAVTDVVQQHLFLFSL